MASELTAPFPWFGGKSRAAHLVWPRFGNVGNYVEPFAGSLAILLGRPECGKIETVNDLDCYIANFWRAVQADPLALAQWASCPVNEADLIARHKWLSTKEEFRRMVRSDPHFFDVKIAGWWVWGTCAWIATGFANGIDIVNASPDGINSRLPHIGGSGRGVNSFKRDNIVTWFSDLAARLDRVRVACGDWSRVVSDAVTSGIGLTGVFLDPPYDDSLHSVKYSGVESSGVAADVRKWAIENGDNRLLRIALCGYDGEHEMPHGWQCVEWKAQGGYGSQGQGRGRDNAKRERIWFSPHCLPDVKPQNIFVFEDEE